MTVPVPIGHDGSHTWTVNTDNYLSYIEDVNAYYVKLLYTCVVCNFMVAMSISHNMVSDIIYKVRPLYSFQNIYATCHEVKMERLLI